MKSLEIYNKLLETYPFAPLSVFKKLTDAQWEKQITIIPWLQTLKMCLDMEKRDAKARAKEYFNNR